MFYPKFAWHNLRHSKAVVAPFLLASVILFLLNGIVIILMLSPVMKTLASGGVVLFLALVVLGLFSTIMEIYSYQFLLKQRQQEFGLYNILGMTKGQISIVSSLELFFLFTIVVVGGSLLTFVFSHFFYLVFANLTHYHQLQLEINPAAFVYTAIIGLVQFALLFLVGLFSIYKSSSLGLFHNQSQGEKEPKGNVLLACLSLLAIGGGYGLSITSHKVVALVVLYRFFIAVLLVIIGTYLFYISFITWYLKRKKNNKSYYYQPQHFIATSQMIFRMKQNAVGLANITLLAVMAFVSVATTVALYTNSQQMVSDLFYKNTKFMLIADKPEQAQKDFQQFVLEPLHLASFQALTYRQIMLGLPLDEKAKVTVTAQDILKPSVKKLAYTYIITEKTYQALGNKTLHLQENQIALYRQKNITNIQEINFLGKTLQVSKHISKNSLPDATNTYNPAVMVVKNQQVLNDLLQRYNNITPLKTSESFEAQLNLTQKDLKTLGDKEGMVTDGKHTIAVYETKTGFLNDIYAFFGGFLFTGFLLGTAFILGAALIIYYKQYSEGLQDKKSYKILQEVGMSMQQIKQTINSQIIIVFFMPIAMASLHFSVAFVMLKQLLLIFGVQNNGLIYTVSLATITVIVVLYYFIYKFTSKTYYRIIER
ncbi:MAG: ABC transporter permease [Streptococcus pyogenes]|nr:MAG: ABC transporter permease [Streptococcus pyogenes]